MEPAIFAQTTNFILKPLSWLFSKVIELIYNGVFSMMEPNYAGIMGITIILFTVIFRVLLFPLSLKQQRSTRKMQRIQPKIQRIQDKYKDKKDPESAQRMQAEMNAIYKENKTSPLSGCLPLLLQMPILFVLYEILRNTAFYITDYGKYFDTLTSQVMAFPNFQSVLSENFADLIKSISKCDVSSSDAATVLTSVKDLLAHFTKNEWNTFYGLFGSSVSSEFKGIVSVTQELNSFIGFNLTDKPGWGFPGILWPIVSGVTTWLQSWLMTKANDKRTIAAGGDPKANNGSTMKTMNLIMPFFMAFIMISVPLGIGLYWIVGNFLSILQQILLDRIVDNEEYKEALKRRAELEEKIRLKELAKSNIDRKTGKRIGTAQQTAAMRSAMAGNKMAASNLRQIAASEEEAKVAKEDAEKVIASENDN